MKMQYVYYYQIINQNVHVPEVKINLSQALDFAEDYGWSREKAKKLLHDPNIGEVMCDNDSLRIWTEEK